MTIVNRISARFRHLLSALKETFSTTEGWLVAFGGFAFILLFAAVLSNLKLLGFIAQEDYFSLGLKLKAALQTLWGGRVTFLHKGGPLTLALAVLFGINVAFIVRYMRRQVRMHRAAGASALGVLVGLLGVGCAACGSALFASLLGTGSALAALPLRGQEFTWLGIALVLLSTFSLARKLVEPEACARP
ncbi:MAG: hypothetical protein QY323_02775 [Patescibacteria group bacterium]|nr:MAG: hypothetical protein QY323_02775 [Patescibacteria group bacterium]